MFNNVPLGLVAYKSEPWAESDVIKMKKNKLAVPNTQQLAWRGS